MFEALIKVGGSICNTQSLKALASQWAALASRRSLLFVAGGGLFADQVRALDKHLGLSDRAAHWMAIAAMEQNGHLLGDYMPGIPLISDFGFRILIHRLLFCFPIHCCARLTLYRTAGTPLPIRWRPGWRDTAGPGGWCC